MVWAETVGSDSNIFASAGPGTTVELLSRRANDQFETAVAQNGAATLAVSFDWRRTPDEVGVGRLSFTRIAADGTRPPGPGTLMYPARGQQSSPDAAWNGTDTWVVWSEIGGVFAARFDANGTLLDREPIEVARGFGFRPSIACGPADCLVAWLPDAPGPFRIRSVRFAPNGTRLDAEPADHGAGFLGDVVRAGDGYALTRHAADGLFLVRVGRGETKIAPYGDVSSAVAWSGSEYLVAWRMGPELFHTRADAAGNLLGTPPQLLARGTDPRAIWTGRHFLVGWHFAGRDVEGARITRGGVIADTFPIAASPAPELGPALAMRDDGTFVVSFTRAHPEPPYWGAQRNVVRFGRD